MESVLDLLATDPEESDVQTCTLDPLPCRTAVYLGGEVPWDSCEGSCTGDREGMLYASLVGLNPVTGQDPGGCPTWNFTFDIGVLRCIHGLTDSGKPPKPEDIAADAARQADDADAVFYAFTCCPTRPEALRVVTLQSWRPLGPQGRCAGGAWTVRGRLDACC